MNDLVDHHETEILMRQGPAAQTIIDPRPGEWGVPPAVVLINPKFGHNVGATIRTCSCFGIGQVWFTGNRVSLDPGARSNRMMRKTAREHFRLPREERMRGYADVRLFQNDRPLDQFTDFTPVCVEIREAESLHDFVHPANAVYIFGPEDGSVGADITRLCHRFVRIPSKHCFNLGVAVSLVLYDRALKESLHAANR